MQVGDLVRHTQHGCVGIITDKKYAGNQEIWIYTVQFVQTWRGHPCTEYTRDTFLEAVCK